MTTVRQLEKMSDDEIMEARAGLMSKCSFETGWIFAMMQQGGKEAFDMVILENSDYMHISAAYHSTVRAIREKMTSAEKMLKNIDRHLKQLERLEGVWKARLKTQRVSTI